MSAWLAGAALLVYLAGFVAVAYLFGHYWPELREEDPTLDHLADTQPVAVALLVTLMAVAWPITIPLAIHDIAKNGDPS
ncbi:hypothetical protein ACIOEZ_34005 [Streptomyces sp. NPDC087866]|uniref:hypothetical protein n=1 Tax=Streptomyces sp. NPDC087866 TaxID=3365815 RepID=UPI0037F43543